MVRLLLGRANEGDPHAEVLSPLSAVGVKPQRESYLRERPRRQNLRGRFGWRFRHIVVAWRRRYSYAGTGEKRMSTIVLEDTVVHIPPWVVDLASFRRWTELDEFPEKGASVTWPARYGWT